MHRQGDLNALHAANDDALGVAGLRSPWNPKTGAWELSFTLLKINADTPPLFMHMALLHSWVD